VSRPATSTRSCSTLGLRVACGCTSDTARQPAYLSGHGVPPAAPAHRRSIAAAVAGPPLVPRRRRQRPLSRCCRPTMWSRAVPLLERARAGIFHIRDQATGTVEFRLELPQPPGYHHRCPYPRRAHGRGRARGAAPAAHARSAEWHHRQGDIHKPHPLVGASDEPARLLCQRP
jgi:hypothetical protein